MTTADEPQLDLDEAAVRNELARELAVCDGCRRCVSLCGTFPTLFDLLERVDDRDTGRMTPAQQDVVVDECFHCGRCALGCPYTPERHELAVDVPRLMLRVAAMRAATGQAPMRSGVTRRVLGRGVRLGAITRSRPGSVARRVTRIATGVTSQRVLPPRTRERFSTWFRARRPASPTTATLVPTCIVEHHAPAIGRDLVTVLDHLGVGCQLGGVTCCGASWLHAGDVDRFRKVARENVAALTTALTATDAVVVAQPTCADVIRHEYPRHVPGPDTDRVAAHVHDATSFVLQRAQDAPPPAGAPSAVTYHAACHARATGASEAASELLALTGATVTVVEQCAGTATTWGLRAANDGPARAAADRLARAVDVADDGVGEQPLVGDCHLAATEIGARAGRPVLHPVQWLARAYGLDDA